LEITGCGGIGILLEAELDGDLALIGAADRGDHIDRIDAGNGVFQRLGDLRLDHFGRGTGVAH
jgi:hypothetical protein